VNRGHLESQGPQARLVPRASKVLPESRGQQVHRDPLGLLGPQVLKESKDLQASRGLRGPRARLVHRGNKDRLESLVRLARRVRLE
jgi:hypothetical protein